MTVLRVTTFNVNQFSKPDHQRADLARRMKDSDVVLVQETVDLDLEEFVKLHPGWAAFQVRSGDNDGHANTAVLYRVTLGPVVDTAVVDLGAAPHKPGHPHTGSRERFLVAVKFANGEWFGSFHIFRESDAVAIPAMLSKVGVWCAAHPNSTLGVDRNQAPPGLLENTTGLRWHGVGIDGLLTHLQTANVAEFPKGFSDHPGVHADVTLPDPPKEPKPVKPKSRLRQILADLRAALAQFKANGRKGRAKKAQAMIDAAKTKPQPKPTPTPAPAPTPAPTPAPAPVPDVPKSFPAIAAARKQSHEGPQFGVGECLMRVRMCYGIAAREPDAATAWRLAKVKHPTTNIASIPRGYPVFWTGGSKGFGHIAIAAGDGNCWSTDIDRPGFFDYVPIAEIHAKWGLALVGWTEDINGVPIDPNHTGE